MVSIRFIREMPANKEAERKSNAAEFQSALYAKCPPMLPQQIFRFIRTVSIRFIREMPANREFLRSEPDAFVSIRFIREMPANLFRAVYCWDDSKVSIRFIREMPANE